MKSLIRIISVILVVFMVTALFPASVAGTGSDVTRYTVLLLDTEKSFNMLYNGSIIYTVETPIETIKQAGQSFVKQIQEANGTNYVAVVSYSSSVVIESGFTTDTASLVDKIGGITIGEQWADLTAALKKADEMIAAVEDSNAVFNVVLFTQGIASSGEFLSSGRFSQSDCSWYRTDTGIYHYQYSNSAYVQAQAMMNKGLNLYSIGLFKSFDSVPEQGKSLLDFAKTFSSTLQNSGFYDVDDIDKLIFVFGDVADSIIANNDNCPIIVVPGVMGSRLYDDASCKDRLWEPSTTSAVWSAVNPFSQFGKKMTVTNKLYVRDVNDNQVTSSKREYGAQDTYKELVDELCKTYPEREIYFFSYDFRQDNAESARRLKNLIESVVEGEQWDQVDIVCHSMGGLVASSYIEQNGSDRVRTIVTMGTPYEGAPKLVNAVLNWDALTNRYEDDGDFFSFNMSTISDMVLGLGGLQKKVKAGFPALAQLSPTKVMFNAYKNYRYWRSGFLWLKENEVQIDYDEYRDIMNTIFNDKYSDAEQFHEDIKNSKGLNILTDMENSYFVIGINQPTIGALVFNNGDSLGSLECHDLLYEYSGDGTVPYYSSTIAENVTKLNSDRYLKVSDNHSHLVKNDTALKWLKDILSRATTDIKSDEVLRRKYVVIRIACPVEVEVERGNELLSSDITKNSFTASFGCLDITGADSDVKMLCLLANEADELKLIATDDGTMDLTLRWFDEDGNLVEERGFDDVPLKDDEKLTVDTGRDHDTVLSVDEDGDGKVDKSIYPSDILVVDHDTTPDTPDTPDTPEDEPEEQRHNAKPEHLIFPSLFKVKVSVGSGGSTNVSDTFMIARGAGRKIEITPNEGYVVEKVVVNGVDVGSVTEYYITAAVQDYVISITFKLVE